MAQNTFHIALYVRDLDAAIVRYRKLLGQEPAKVRRDYAKFEIADPPVILSLNTGGVPGTVSHLGIRYPGTGDVASEMVRVKQEQVELLEQKGTTCCYAKADKFWVRDADGMPWEMYTLLADAEVAHLAGRAADVERENHRRIADLELGVVVADLRRLLTEELPVARDRSVEIADVQRDVKRVLGHGFLLHRAWISRTRAD